MSNFDSYREPVAGKIPVGRNDMWSRISGLRASLTSKQVTLLSAFKVLGYARRTQPTRIRQPGPLAAMRHRYVGLVVAGLSLSAVILSQDKPSSSIQDAAVSWARACASEIAQAIEAAEDQGDLEAGAAFDRMYIPVPGTFPRQYKTSYDSWADRAIAPILKNTLNSRKILRYVLLTDPNGYIPVAPAIRPIGQIPVPATPKGFTTTSSDLEAARMSGPELIRSIGNTPDGVVTEIVVPVLVRNRPWCVLRMGYIEK